MQAATGSWRSGSRPDGLQFTAAAFEVQGRTRGEPGAETKAEASSWLVRHRGAGCGMPAGCHAGCGREKGPSPDSQLSSLPDCSCTSVQGPYHAWTTTA